MRTTCLTIVIACAVLTTTAAEAQPGATDPVQPSPAAAGKRKSAARARGLSVLVPLITITAGLPFVDGSQGQQKVAAFLLAGGAVIGPSAGLWYAGRGGGLGMIARGAALTVAVGTFAIMADFHGGGDCLGLTDDECADQERDEKVRVGIVVGLGVAATAGYFWSWIHDAREAGRIVERRNATQLMVAPAMLSNGRDRVPGAMLSLRF